MQNQNEKMDQSQIIKFEQVRQKRQENQKSFPWNSKLLSEIDDPIIRLHNEIIQYYLWVTNQQSEQQMNQVNSIKQILNGVCIKVISITDFTNILRGDAIEIFATLENIKKCKIKQMLEEMGCTEFKSTIKYEHIGESQVISCKSTSKVEIVVHCLPIQMSNFISSIADHFKLTQFKFLFCILMTLTTQRGLNKKIGSLLIIGLLGMFFWERKNIKGKTLAQTLLKFLEYYGNGAMNELKIGKIKHIQNIKYEYLHQNKENSNLQFWVSQACNLSTTSMRQLLYFLKNRYRIISNFNFSQGKSILGMLINPSNGDFYK